MTYQNKSFFIKLHDPGKNRNITLITESLLTLHITTLPLRFASVTLTISGNFVSFNGSDILKKKIMY